MDRTVVRWPQDGEYGETAGGPMGNGQCCRRRMRGAGKGISRRFGGVCSLGKARDCLGKVRRLDRTPRRRRPERDARGAPGALADATSRCGTVCSANVLT
jgi:hypothetical protein